SVPTRRPSDLLLLIQRGVRHEAPFREEKPAPRLEQEANAEGEAKLVLSIWRVHRLHALKISPERRDILIPHAAVGGVGEGRIVGLSLWRTPFAQGTSEILFAPVPQPLFRMGRDVGAVEGAERRADCPPSGQEGPFLRKGMATFTGSGNEDLAAPLDLRIRHLILGAGGSRDCQANQQSRHQGRANFLQWAS